MKFNQYSPPYTAYYQWSGLVEEGKYRVIAPSAIDGLLPQQLLDKSNSILVMATASANSTIFLANLNRVDTPASAVDQQPYIVEFNHYSSIAFGGFINHGNWFGRTTQQSQDFFNQISVSGTGSNYPLSQMPIGETGLLTDLSIASQNAALHEAVSGLNSFKISNAY